MSSWLSFLKLKALLNENRTTRFIYPIASGRTPVERTKSKFSALGRPKRVKNPGEQLYAPLVQSSEGKYSFQVQIFEFYLTGPKCRDGTLHSAECHPGISELCISSANQTSMCPRVHMILSCDTRRQPGETQNLLTRTSRTTNAGCTRLPSAFDEILEREFLETRLCVYDFTLAMSSQST